MIQSVYSLIEGVLWVQGRSGGCARGLKVWLGAQTLTVLRPPLRHFIFLYLICFLEGGGSWGSGFMKEGTRITKANLLPLSGPKP